MDRRFIYLSKYIFSKKNLKFISQYNDFKLVFVRAPLCRKFHKRTLASVECE